MQEKTELLGIWILLVISCSSGVYSVLQTIQSTYSESKGRIEDITIASVVPFWDTIDYNMTFELLEPSPWVYVNEYGEIKVKKKWDYEALPAHQKYVSFWVLFTNATKESLQRFIWSITDVNDELPVFVNEPKPFYTVIPLNAKVNDVIFTLEATDPDTNSDIRYQITRDESNSFVIDNKSGVIRINNTKSFQLGKEYQLFVKAEDRNGRNGNLVDYYYYHDSLELISFQETPEERISVVAGIRPPQFFKKEYSTNMSENTPVGQSIISVKAKAFGPGEIIYAMEPYFGTFKIDKKSGVVSLDEELDFDKEDKTSIYNLTITAKENHGSSFASVNLTIILTDINDNAPSFESAIYQVGNIDEDVPVGTSLLKVKAIDGDEGQNGEIVYEIKDDSFRIDNLGIIYNAKELDVDARHASYYHKFSVYATDKGEPSQESSATVYIHLNNKNDEEPMFSQFVYTPNVNDTAVQGTFVTKVSAKDIDLDKVEYAFDGGVTENGIFSINKYTGEISLNSDYVYQPGVDKHELNVTATDDGSCCPGGNETKHTSHAVVVVFTSDINDNAPTFENCSNYQATVIKNALIGAPVITVKAQDQDKGLNGWIKYSVVEVSNKTADVRVDERTGEVFTNRLFNKRDVKASHLSLTIRAVDEGKIPLQTVCSFKIKILDSNDHAPVFNQTIYSVNLNQNTEIGSEVTKVLATDEDSGNNGLILYRFIEGNQYFRIDPTSGLVLLQQHLDQEPYTTKVVAFDRGIPVRQSTATFTVTLVNSNNGLPILDSEFPQKLTIPENLAVGRTVLSLKASSGIDDNPDVFYRVVHGSSKQTNKDGTFYIESRMIDGQQWADVKLHKQLEFEDDVRVYLLTIRAQNHRVHSRATESVIEITLADVNDEIPMFVEREPATIVEGESVGTLVTQILAIDKDGTSPNNKVMYRIIDSAGETENVHFAINEETGEIFTKSVFDVNKNYTYNLRIEARDGAPSIHDVFEGKPNIVTKNIPITVLAKRDLVFENNLPYEVEVNENEAIRHILLNVLVKDHYKYSDIVYNITGGNIGEVFAINYTTGEIFVAGIIDYESVREYELQVTASRSNDERVVTTSVIIKVRDIDDLFPTFENTTYYAKIREEDDRGLPSKILQVKAKSNNIRREQSLVYSLEGQGIDKNNTENSKFEINSTSGIIYVKQSLDRDPPNGQPIWNFMVLAKEDSETEMIGYANVEVVLEDINDNPPIFSVFKFYGYADENAEKGEFVMRVSAVDNDDVKVESNSKLTYSIEKNAIEEETGNVLFDIEPDTGIIRTASCCLDFEKLHSYFLTIVAEDGKGLRGSCEAVVHIIDKNDNPLIFLEEDWIVRINESSISPNTSLLSINVEDGDYNANNLYYEVIEDSGYGADKFTIVKNKDHSGSLRLIKPLDYEDHNQRVEFKFRIQVSDNGANMGRKNQSWVNIILSDINDIAPEFYKKSPIFVSVNENITIGHKIKLIDAYGKGQLFNGESKISYKIDKSSDPDNQFKISKYGYVKSKYFLDREQAERHVIKILAIDEVPPFNTATATLVVNVQDVNDNAPQLLEEYNIILKENENPGEIINIFAYDQDDFSIGNGPPFTFELSPEASDDIRSSFKVFQERNQNNKINNEMATIYSTRKFQGEKGKKYHLPIVITDNGDPPRSETSLVTVTIV